MCFHVTSVYTWYIHRLGISIPAARPLHQESQIFTGMEKDVIAGGAGGMGSCPPPQHQLPGAAYAHDIHCISM